MLSPLIPVIATPLERFIPDKTAREKAAHDIAVAIENYALENQAKSQHRSIFMDGWQSFTGWVCAVAYLWHLILNPVILFFAALFGMDAPPILDFDTGPIAKVLAGLIVLRIWEIRIDLLLMPNIKTPTHPHK